ncbi:MAG: hypothetical protein ACTH5U_10500, partial [Pseudomonadales bacterium]
REKLKARFYGFLLIKASRASCFCKVVTLMTISHFAITDAHQGKSMNDNTNINMRNSHDK